MEALGPFTAVRKFNVGSDSGWWHTGTGHQPQLKTFIRYIIYVVLKIKVRIIFFLIIIISNVIFLYKRCK